MRRKLQSSVIALFIALLAIGFLAPSVAVHAAAKPQQKTPHTSPSQAKPNWGCGGFYLKNVRSSGYYEPTLASTVGYWPTSTIHLSINQSISNTWGANVGISAGVVSAGVNFSVTATYGVTQSADASVRPGGSTTLYAFAVYDEFVYEVWDSPCLGGDYKVGSGWADQYDHIQFSTANR